MTAFTTLEPHAALPDGPAIILMRRFEEDDPHHMMMELIVIHANQSEETSRLLDAQGMPLGLDQARERAARQSAESGIAALYYIDRTAGPRERVVTAHDGDRSYDLDGLSDTDEADGVTGSDMRDRGQDGAPRKF
jgi:hypothetical protein